MIDINSNAFFTLWRRQYLKNPSFRALLYLFASVFLLFSYIALIWLPPYGGSTSTLLVIIGKIMNYGSQDILLKNSAIAPDNFRRMMSRVLDISLCIFSNFLLKIDYDIPTLITMTNPIEKITRMFRKPSHTSSRKGCTIETFLSSSNSIGNVKSWSKKKSHLGSRGRATRYLIEVCE